MDRMLSGSQSEENERKETGGSYKKFTHAVREAFLKKVKLTEENMEKQRQRKRMLDSLRCNYHNNEQSHV